MSWPEVLVIYQQLAGQPLQGKRLVVRPGTPFAPEKDGSTFLGGGFGGRDRDASARY